MSATPMTVTASPKLGQIHALLAEAGYEVSEAGPDTLRIRETESGIVVQVALEGDILFFSLVCTVVPRAEITAEIMGRMLGSDNGISTSHFQLYDAGDGKIAVALENFCKVQTLSPDDQDDVLSCVHFLLQDVMTARRLLSELGN